LSWMPPATLTTNDIEGFRREVKEPGQPFIFIRAPGPCEAGILNGTPCRGVIRIPPTRTDQGS